MKKIRIDISDYLSDDEILEDFSDEELQEELESRGIKIKDIRFCELLQVVIERFENEPRYILTELLGLSHYATTQQILDELAKRL